MTAQPPTVPDGQQTIGLAWSIPVLLAVYCGLGYWLGGLLGSKLIGTVAGWGVGMGAVIYEIRKVLHSGGNRGGAD